MDTGGIIASGGLSALGEGGGGNTAPSSPTIEWTNSGTHDLTETITAAQAVQGAEIAIFRAADNSDLDAEGGPLSWGFIDDPTGRLLLTADGADYVITVYPDHGDIPVGEYVFVIGVQDSGGLFSSTSYTLTVTESVTELAVAGVSDTDLSYDGTHYTFVNINNCAFLTAVTFTSNLQTVDESFLIYACPITDISGLGTIKKIGGNFSITGAALSEASVDYYLMLLAGLDGSGGTTVFENVTVDLSGGTSAPPSGDGLAAKAVLEGRGCTVTVNGLPAPPAGFHYIVNADGKYIINADGAYILADGDS